MKINQIKTGSMVLKSMQKIIAIALLAMVIICCSKEGEPNEIPAGDSEYSGIGNFAFTGDFNQNFQGNIKKTKVGEQNGVQNLPMSFVDNTGKELFMSISGPKIEPRTYELQDFDTATNEAGFASIMLSGERYGSDAIGGKGTITIIAASKKKINGSVNMRLARPLNTADTVKVVGSFELKAN